MSRCGQNCGRGFIVYHAHTHICTCRAECGGEFTIFVTSNHIILSCGRGDRGALGHGPGALEDGLKPKLIEPLLSQDTVGVACGESHVVAITSEGGGVFTWGEGTHGRLGNSKEAMWYVTLLLSHSLRACLFSLT